MILKIAITAVLSALFFDMATASFVFNDGDNLRYNNSRNNNYNNRSTTNNNKNYNNNNSNSRNNTKSRNEFKSVNPDPFLAFDPFKSSSVSDSFLNSSTLDPFKAIRHDLKVATFNIWGLITSKDRTKRIEAITRYFTKNPRGLDVLCLQELWMADDYRTVRAALSLEFPHAHYFKSGVVGSGLAIFSKYPIRDAWWKGFTLTGKAHRIFDGDWYAGKGIGAVRIKHPMIGDIDVFNTHLIANYSPTDYDADWYKSHRATQLYELIRHVDRTSNPTAYTIVMGDLNTQPVEDSYKSMIRGHELYTPYQKPLRNIWRDIAKSRRKQTREIDESSTSPLNQTDPDQWSTTTMLMSNENGKYFTCNLRTNSYYQSSMPEQQIDHILYVPDGRMQCIEASVFLTHPTRDASGRTGPSYSDHAAVMAVFSIKPSDQVVLNSPKRKHKKLASNSATQKLMVRLNEDLESLKSQQWSYRVFAIVCGILVVGLLIGSVFLMRKANDTDEHQKYLSIANAPDKYKWHEKISFNWYAMACLLFIVPISLYCYGLVWNAVVFAPQEIFGFKEFQYEWALWLRNN